ncbi:MAG: Hsp20/alpha crystallin family protein [Syntrophaceae bacterium]
MFEPRLWRVGRMTDMGSGMQNLQREINRLFSGFTPPFVHEFPAVNVWLGKDDVIVTAELPGMDPGSIDISVAADTLTLSGAREKEVLKEGENYHRQERNYSNFTRTLQLPYQVNAGKVSAKYEKGILHIKLPRSEETKPKKISIKSS